MTDPVLVLKEKVRVLEMEVKTLKNNNQEKQIIEDLKSQLNETKALVIELTKKVSKLSEDKVCIQEPKIEQEQTKEEVKTETKQTRNGKKL